jgi:hypothetical protein
MCNHPTALLKGTSDGITCACGATFATWAELEEARKEEPAKPESKSVKRRKKATE